MQKSFEQEYAKAEKYGAWFLKRKQLVHSFLKGYNRNSKIIEIGCGSGYILDYLQKKGFHDVFGVDSSKYFMQYYPNIRKSMKLIVEKEKYDVVLLLDVIEHVKIPKELIKKIHKMLKPNGTLLISAPAYTFLWGYHDVLNQHYRRYTRKSLIGLLKPNGFNTLRSTYWNSIMMPMIFLIRKLQNIMKIEKSSIESTPDWFNTIYSIILSIENFLIEKGIRLPFGVSIFVLAKKAPK